MIKAIKGFRDILPPETLLWQYVEKVSRNILHNYGFSELRLPLVEDTSLFIRSIGEETDIVSKEMYTFPDRKGHSITLRPEGTASVVRSLVEHKLYGQDQYKKLYYLGPMFRYERPQAGRSRQFHQIGAEIFGLAEPGIDAELLIMVNDLFNQLGLSDIILSLNSVGCSKCRPDYKKALQESLRQEREGLCPDCQQRYEKNPLRVLDCKNEDCQPILSRAPSILQHLCMACQEHHQDVERLLNLAKVPFQINSRLVRGLDYYTRTAFEVVYAGLGAQNAVAGGGRYDNLVEGFGGPKTPAIGFALGVERLVLALQGKGIHPQPRPCVYLATLGIAAKEKGFLLARQLRQNGLYIEISHQDRSLKSHLKQAGRLSSLFCLILGENELAEQQIIIRDMKNSSQESVSLDKISEVLKAKLSVTIE